MKEEVSDLVVALSLPEAALKRINEEWAEAFEVRPCHTCKDRTEHEVVFADHTVTTLKCRRCGEPFTEEVQGEEAMAEKAARALALAFSEEIKAGADIPDNTINIVRLALRSVEDIRNRKRAEARGLLIEKARGLFDVAPIDGACTCHKCGEGQQTCGEDWKFAAVEKGKELPIRAFSSSRRTLFTFPDGNEYDEDDVVYDVWLGESEGQALLDAMEDSQ